MRALFHADPAPPRVSYAWVLLSCVLVGWAFVRTAAVTEDAFITFRVIDNALNGYGLVWNVGERVQPYTHPLWALLLLAFSALSGEIFHTALALSLALTIACVALIVRGAQGRWTALWALLALLFSESFIEYSGAALENALAHALVAAMVVSLQRVSREDSHLAWLPALCAGLLAITRHDLAILAGPVVVGLLIASRGKSRWRCLFACAAPLVLWSLLSIIYYGTPWPNSAYAKLNNGMSWRESIVAAEPYFRDLIKYDAVTAVMIVIAIFFGAFQRRWQLRVPAWGLVLYLAYLGAAGGDYMGGRLFSPPFVMAVTLIALSVRLNIESRGKYLTPICLIVTIVLGLQRGWMVWDVHPHAETRKMSQHAWMYPITGWRSPQRVADFHNLPWGEQGLKARAEKHAVVAKCAVGLYGFNAGPSVHIIDPLAITDGFLSRLPSKKPSYPGHFERALPHGYVESVLSGRNELADASLRALYEKTQLLSRAPLLDAARLQAIWTLNTGGDRALVVKAKYDPNDTFAPGLVTTSREPLSCMGQLDPMLTVRLR
jgi:arabinofuranosyltransferase